MASLHAITFAFFITACSSESAGTSSDAGPDVLRVDAGHKRDAALDADDVDAADANCGDTTSSPDNCGACGHSCSGGACASGVCHSLAIGAFGVSWLALNTSLDVVTVGGNFAFAVPSDLQTANPIPLIPTGLQFTTSKVIAATMRSLSPPTALYALSNGQLRTVAWDGTNDALTYATGQYTIWGIAYAGGQLFWTDYMAHTVTRCTWANCAATATVVFDAMSEPVRGIAYDGTSIYITLASSIVKMAADGTGAAPFLTLAAGEEPIGVALDTTYLYFTVMDGNTDINRLRRCTLNNCAKSIVELDSSPFVQGSQIPSAVAVDSLNVYWSDRMTFFRLALPL